MTSFLFLIVLLYSVNASPVGQTSTVIATQSQSSPGVSTTTTIVNGHVVDHVVVTSSPSPVFADISSLLAGVMPLGVLPTLSKQVTSQPLADEAPLLSAPINQTTKLVIDVNEQITQYLPADEVTTNTTTATTATNATIAPSLYFDTAAESKQGEPTNSIQVLIEQVTRLADTIDTTISDLGNRGRNATATLLRSTLNYVRRVRTNLERLQLRLPTSPVLGQNVTTDATDSTSNLPFFNSIRDRINRMTEEIGALVNRIRGTFISSPVELTSTPLPPQVNSIGAAVASGTILSTINSLNSPKFTKPGYVIPS